MSGLTNVLLAGFFGLTPSLAVENTNIGRYQEPKYVTDLNRLRADLSLEHEKHRDFIGKLIVDNKTDYSSDPSSFQNETTIYRAYLQFRGNKHFWSLGKQRIPLGVGRIWNPIDVFNPIDSEAIEPEERSGTESIRYEYALSDLSNIDSTLAKGKGAMRIKGFLDYADVALVGLWDEGKDRNIIGWELEGQLQESGVELRSEGGSFLNRSTDEWHTEFIVGAEYGFANSLTLLAEYKYSDDTKTGYLGTNASYQPAMLWLCNLLIVSNLKDNSGFIAPSVEYSLSDEMTLSTGAFVYYGNEADEFGLEANFYFLRWFVHF